MLKQLRDYKEPLEQDGRLCFLTLPTEVDEGEEIVYVISNINGSEVELVALDRPEDIYRVDFILNDVYIMNPEYVVNRVTEW